MNDESDRRNSSTSNEIIKCNFKFKIFVPRKDYHIENSDENPICLKESTVGCNPSICLFRNEAFLDGLDCSLCHVGAMK